MHHFAGGSRRSAAASEKQHETAPKLIESGGPPMVCKTVLLEPEWLMRSYCELSRPEASRVMKRLLALPQLTAERREHRCSALPLRSGRDVGDVLNNASDRACDSVFWFNEEKACWERQTWKLAPRVLVPE